ncbi:3-(3-hydroxy-phenyl)propionate transporter MhpT [Allorhizobium sp. BGMRC 0089]|uniref:3-(3-hydroxy-phenyl)propionate transporter MhpT n=1 Tax=Allorhizobium sonneratiae TaxID=2934936 RepID=UPI002034221A|nr:3-(3-hydroxy-phenyl)propionate transporter MhpT [Allorhizobium sonneratiae]MCM2294486.1 3-(3-hydroxy-phenyl)propionate transporter MhpT [Allorhizobium sonneratiae]
MQGSAAKTGASRIFLLIFLAAMIEGFDLQAAGVAAPKLAPYFKLTPAEMGLFFSSATFGLIFGAIFGGFVSDRFGRRLGLALSLIVFGIFSMATAAAGSIESLVVLRFLTGLGLGGALPNLVSIAAEAAKPERRGWAVSLMYAGVPLGGGVASVIAMAGLHDDWRSIFIAGGIMPVLLVGPLLALLPPLTIDKAEKEASTGAWKQLFSQTAIARTLLLWIGFFFSILVLYLLLNWLPTLLVTRGLGREQAGVIQLVFNVAGACGSLLAGWSLDSDRKVLNGAICFALLVGSLILMGLAPASMAINTLAGAMVGVSIMAAQALLYGIAPQCYTTDVRGTGVGLAVAAGRIGSVVGPLLGGGLVASGRSPSEVLMAIVPVALIGGIATLVLMARISGQPKQGRSRVATAAAKS